VGLRDSERTRVTRITELAAGPDAGRPGDACIVVIYGTELGKRLELGAAPFEIGRSSNNDLFIDQESVSRHHARITYHDGKYSLSDLGSTNGTFINDESVRERPLHDGDQVRIGRSILKFMTGENVEVHYHEEIYRLMTVDGLTQAYNRRYFDEALEREFNRSKRYERSLSLILFDIDHFKRVNDTLGHLAGDEVLREISGLVARLIRQEDVFARYGGEEFVVLARGIDHVGTARFAERLRASVERLEIAAESSVVRVTISLGLASLDELGEGQRTVEGLLRLADSRLYAAKAGGRNRVCAE